MILGGGALDGRRYVSEASVRRMTSTQTRDLLDGNKGLKGYGLGWITSKKSQGDADPAIVGPCGHGGAYRTDMWIDPERQLIMVYMVQYVNHPGDKSGRILAAFRKAAMGVYSNGAKTP
jgi:CubicO group peptidase (beta-lactamase class C family)